jgi:hypothetical protein
MRIVNCSSDLVLRALVGWLLAALLVGADGSAVAQSKPPRKPRIPGSDQLLGDILKGDHDTATKFDATIQRVEVDETKLKREGIRKLTGRRLTLYTDLPSKPWIDELPQVVDQAFPQWCEYFQIDPNKYPDWKLTGFLINEKARFVLLGLLPKGLPNFQNGYARNFEFWLYDKPSEYYTRHLLLHECVHCFMLTTLGACGAPWYMEGTAELLATHRWKDGKLTLNYNPPDRDEVPEWGRVRIIKDALAAGKPESLQTVIDYQWNAHIDTGPYAWVWATALLMDRHPRYHDRFRQLYRLVQSPDFNAQFHQVFAADWEQLEQDWELLTRTIEYGYDVAAEAVDYRPGKPLPAQPVRLKISVARGWQNSGLQLAAGTPYHVRAVGRYQVDDQPQVWWCEPGGVSIRYYRGRPLGILLAAVRPDSLQNGQKNPLLDPVPIGLGATLTPESAGTLFLKINDSAAELADNAGELWVEIKWQEAVPAQSPPPVPAPN